MLSKKDFLLVCQLRQNARESLTRMSRKTHIPISTIYDKLKNYEHNLIKKHTSLLNFAELGFNTRASIMLKINKDARTPLKEFLLKNQNINSVYKVNNGFDFMIEGIFRQIKDLEEFIEQLEEKFDIQEKQVYYIIEDIKREGFLTNSNLIELVS